MSLAWLVQMAHVAQAEEASSPLIGVASLTPFSACWAQHRTLVFPRVNPDPDPEALLSSPDSLSNTPLTLSPNPSLFPCPVAMLRGASSHSTPAPTCPIGLHRSSSCLPSSLQPRLLPDRTSLLTPFSSCSSQLAQVPTLEGSQHLGFLFRGTNFAPLCSFLHKQFPRANQDPAQVRSTGLLNE